MSLDHGILNIPLAKRGELSEEMARQVAHIVGPHSAAGRALDELARRREAGEDAAIYVRDGRLLVGPRLAREGK